MPPATSAIATDANPPFFPRAGPTRVFRCAADHQLPLNLHAARGGTVPSWFPAYVVSVAAGYQSGSSEPLPTPLLQEKEILAALSAAESAAKLRMETAARKLDGFCLAEEEELRKGSLSAVDKAARFAALKAERDASWRNGTLPSRKTLKQGRADFRAEAKATRVAPRCDRPDRTLHCTLGPAKTATASKPRFSGRSRQKKWPTLQDSPVERCGAPAPQRDIPDACRDYPLRAPRGVVGPAGLEPATRPL